jgi:hypothetical protein
VCASLLQVRYDALGNPLPTKVGEMMVVGESTAARAAAPRAARAESSDPSSGVDWESEETLGLYIEQDYS